MAKKTRNTKRKPKKQLSKKKPNKNKKKTSKSPIGRGKKTTSSGKLVALVAAASPKFNHPDIPVKITEETMTKTPNRLPEEFPVRNKQPVRRLGNNQQHGLLFFNQPNIPGKITEETITNTPNRQTEEPPFKSSHRRKSPPPKKQPKRIKKSKKTGRGGRNSGK